MAKFGMGSRRAIGNLPCMCGKPQTACRMPREVIYEELSIFNQFSVSQHAICEFCIKDQESVSLVAEEEVKERARRAAAAARRWREHSRRGTDKPPTYKLPEAVELSNKD